MLAVTAVGEHPVLVRRSCISKCKGWKFQWLLGNVSLVDSVTKQRMCLPRAGPASQPTIVQCSSFLREGKGENWSKCGSLNEMGWLRELECTKALIFIKADILKVWFGKLAVSFLLLNIHKAYGYSMVTVRLYKCVDSKFLLLSSVWYLIPSTRNSVAFREKTNCILQADQQRRLKFVSPLMKQN